MRIRFVGSGDAFSSGGRYHSCILVQPGGRPDFLVEFGASAMVALRRFGVEPNAISTILVSHLHGDHFAGLPFFLIDAQWVSARTGPLTIAGPPGLEARLRTLMEAMYPGFDTVERSFPVTYAELSPSGECEVDGLRVRTREASHPSGAPSLSLRIQCGGVSIAFSGDTEWTDGLAEISRGADLLVTECCFPTRQTPYHLDLETLRARRDELDARRIILTHMGQSMLDARPLPDFETAEDGLEIQLG